MTTLVHMYHNSHDRNIKIFMQMVFSFFGLTLYWTLLWIIMAIQNLLSKIDAFRRRNEPAFIDNNIDIEEQNTDPSSFPNPPDNLFTLDSEESSDDYDDEGPISQHRARTKQAMEDMERIIREMNVN